VSEPSDKPILQVALDFIELDRALRVAEEAVAGGADWIESGTLLIKSVGLESVRALRSRFPNHTIVADMKTMDAGRLEVEYAAKAGANVVYILAAASDSTVRECVAAGREYGAKIITDVMELPDPIGRAKHMEALGVDGINLHTPIDRQMRAADSFAQLRELCAAVSIPVSVAGGINSENAAQAVAAGARVIVIGGSITKSADARTATAEIKRAITEGVSIPTELYRRGGAERIREVLSKISTSNLSDAMHRGGVLDGIKPIVRGLRLVGTAYCVRTAPGDWSKPVQAIDHAQPGDVIVIDAGGVGPAIWGELATHSAAKKGIAGVVVDGAIRDTAEIVRMGFPAFSRLYMPNALEPRGLGELNVPVKISGTTVHPGDWLLGDDDGLVLIPKDEAVEWANRGMGVLELENRLRAEIEAGHSLAELQELAKWDKPR
jgi:3-hexulose-6-phosphate synthase / 6-phospho-3-hexuloisomerase